jgi:hypothetical protein
MNPSGTDDRARRSEAQTRGRLQGAKRYSNEKKILSSSPTTPSPTASACLIGSMAEESAREDGTRGRGLDDDRDIVCSPFHFLPASLGKEVLRLGLPVRPCDCDPSSGIGESFRVVVP